MDASSARKKLQNIPDKLSIYKQYAEKASKNKDDEYALSVYYCLKSSNKSERVVPYTWEIEYDIEELRAIKINP